MNFFKNLGRFLYHGSRAHAEWEISTANTILRSRKRMMVLGLLLIPIIIGGVVFADQLVGGLPDYLGGILVEKTPTVRLSSP